MYVEIYKINIHYINKEINPGLIFYMYKIKILDINIEILDN